VLPLRDIVVFPRMIVPLFVGRKKPILALEEAIRFDTLGSMLLKKARDFGRVVIRSV
jgi:ATP-dependent Lon protease